MSSQPPASDPYLADGPYARQAALDAAAAGIRVRRGPRIPIEHILLIGGSVLLPLGLVLVLLGWDGAAHNGHTYAQISYLISGGLFGLGLSVAGGLMYFGYWLTRQMNEAPRQSALNLQTLRRIEELLDAGAGAPPSSAALRGPRPLRSRVEARQPAPAPLVATPKGSLLHRPQCPVVAKRNDLRTVAPGTEGYGYCAMCHAAAVLA